MPRSTPALVSLACLLACVPLGANSDEADSGQSSSEDSTDSDSTDSGDSTDTGGPSGGCIDDEGQVNRPYITHDYQSAIFTTHEIDGSSFDLDATIAAADYNWYSIASNVEQVAILVHSSVYNGFEDILATHVLTFDRSDGTLVSTLVIDGYYLSEPTLSPAGILVAVASNGVEPAPGVAIVEGEVIPLLDFDPLGPASEQGWIRGRFEDVGVYGFMAPVLAQSIELSAWRAYLPVGEPERIETMQLDPSALVVSELDQPTVFPVPELQGLDSYVEQGAGRFRLIAGKDPDAPWPVLPTDIIDWTYVRLDLESGARIAIEPVFAPGVEPLPWCGQLQLRPDGRIVYVLQDAERIWIASWDPEAASWTEHGQAMTGIHSVSVRRVVDDWWTVIASWDPLSIECPSEPSPGLPDTLEGNSVQFLELNQGISEDQNIGPYTRAMQTDSHDECAAWPVLDDVTIFDPVDRDQVTVAGDVFVWLE